MNENSNTINVAQTLAVIVSTRDAVVQLRQKIEQQHTSKTELDFAQVQFISRSAAHEFLVLKEQLANVQPKIEVDFTNSNESVSKMLRIVAANRALPKETNVNDVPIVPIEELTKHKAPTINFWRKLFAS